MHLTHISVLKHWEASIHITWDFSNLLEQNSDLMSLPAFIFFILLQFLYYFLCNEIKRSCSILHTDSSELWKLPCFLWGSTWNICLVFSLFLSSPDVPWWFQEIHLQIFHGIFFLLGILGKMYVMSLHCTILTFLSFLAV